MEIKNERGYDCEVQVKPVSLLIIVQSFNLNCSYMLFIEHYLIGHGVAFIFQAMLAYVHEESGLQNYGYCTQSGYQYIIL